MTAARVRVGSHGERAPKELSCATGGRQEVGGAHDLSCFACDQDVNTCRGVILCPIGLSVWMLQALRFPSGTQHGRSPPGRCRCAAVILSNTAPITPFSDRWRVVRNVGKRCCSNTASNLEPVLVNFFALGDLALEKCTAMLQGKFQCPSLWWKSNNLNNLKLCS